MRAGIINGERWIVERLAFLRELLAGDLPEGQRKTVEDEIAVLSRERGITRGGLRPPRWFRRFRRAG